MFSERDDDDDDGDITFTLETRVGSGRYAFSHVRRVDRLAERLCKCINCVFCFSFPNRARYSVVRDARTHTHLRKQF